MSKKVFISYSHDSTEHKSWVRNLATQLVNHGIEVIVDQWDLRVGEDIPSFVEDSILRSDRVLLVCTKKYVEKTKLGAGGVGLEALVIRTSLMRDLGSTKFVVLVRQDDGNIVVPELLASRLYLDFSKDVDFETELLRLIKELHGVTHLDRPILGESPFEVLEVEENDTKLDLARAYMELNDEEGASEILMEVMNDGSLLQQKEARQLLSRIRSSN